jgi:hypothetical protein
MSGVNTNAIDLASFASQSLDPGVRNLVIRRMELAAEITKIDLFFASMHELTTADAGGQLMSALPRSTAGLIPKKQFAEVVRNILLAAGQPLKPTDIFNRFKALYPDCKISGSEAMRKRLFGTKELFRQIDGVGYWPADYPVPVFSAQSKKKVPDAAP